MVLTLVLLATRPVNAACNGTCVLETAGQVAQAAYTAGFRGGALVNAIAIADAESGFALNAIHVNTSSTDYGLWQINSVHGYNSQQLLSDANYNATAAYQISTSGTNWCPWVTFWDGAFTTYLSSPARSAAQQIDSTVIRPITQETGQVHANTDVNVRASAGGTFVRMVSAGALGTVLDGPMTVAFGTCPGTTNSYYYVWWKIHWNDGGADGWSVEDALSRTGGQTFPAPTCSLGASPSSINSGQGATLSWSSQNATSGSISGVGTISPVASGSVSVSPTQTTTYTGTFSGSGGSTTCQTTVTVTSSSPAPSCTIS
jgi:hypothetical protein